MNRDTRRATVDGPAGALACAIDEPAPGPDGMAAVPRGVAVLCHPHPLHGGTMDNKVVQTLARAFLQMGYRAVRFNTRGVDGSAGDLHQVFDHGVGETDDCLAVVAAHRLPGLPLALGGFSFGTAVVARAAERLAARGAPAERLALAGPATSRFQLPAVPADTVVIHGESDEVVPLQATLDWARPQHLPVIVLPGVGHFFHGQLTLLKQQLLQAWHRPSAVPNPHP